MRSRGIHFLPEQDIHAHTLDPVSRPAAVVSNGEHMDFVVHDEIRNVLRVAVNSASPNDESFNLGHRRARLDGRDGYVEIGLIPSDVHVAGLLTRSICSWIAAT